MSLSIPYSHVIEIVGCFLPNPYFSSTFTTRAIIESSSIFLQVIKRTPLQWIIIHFAEKKKTEINDGCDES